MKNIENELQEVPCNICSSKNYEIICKKGRFSQDVYNVICKDCGLVYQSPRWSENFKIKFYKEHYYSYYINGLDENYEILIKKRDEKAKKRIDFLFKNIKLVKGANCLEIGCSSGNFLFELCKNGYNVKGIEPSKKDADLAKTFFNIEITNDFVENVDFENQKFHLIAMFHTLEHLSDPKGFFKKFREHLYEDGFFYIETPSILRNPGIKPKEDFFRAVHNYSFSPFTLNNLLKMCGYEIIHRDNKYYNIRVIIKKINKFDDTLPQGKEVKKEIRKVKNHLRFWNILSFYNKNLILFKKKIKKLLGFY